MKLGFEQVLVATSMATLAICDAPERSVSVSAARSYSAMEPALEDAARGDVEPRLKTVIDLRDLTALPDAYAWFEFRPNVKKLILAGAPEGQHIAILWYTTQDGGVGLHYHANTESVFVIDGTQTDAKGVYPTGSIYFNPPGSGHQITKSSGFFLLAYASPPDFKNTALIAGYTPVRIDTAAADLTTAYAFTRRGDGVSVYEVPVDPKGGMKAQLTELNAAAEFSYTGSYVLVVRGSCVVDGITHGPAKLVVSKGVAPEVFRVAAISGSCVTLGVSF